MFYHHNNHYPLTRKSHTGFTLIEILIALFIFTIVSMMLLGGLRTVIAAHSGTEANAERLRETQVAFLLLSRDIEQAVIRPVLNTSGSEDVAFSGSSNSFTFTHTGFANFSQALTHSAMERTQYSWYGNALWRVSWPVLDLAATTKSHARRLLNNVVDAKFQYLDKDGKFNDDWPLSGQNDQPLPRAVRISLTISHWGEISQLYVISAQLSKSTQSAPQS